MLHVAALNGWPAFVTALLEDGEARKHLTRDIFLPPPSEMGLGRLEEAETTQRDALARLEGLGDHPLLAAAVGNLAVIRSRRGDAAEAEVLLRRSLEMFDRTVGRDHPYAVRVVKASAEIGGQFNMAKQIPGKEEFYETLRYFKKQIEIHQVNLNLKF